MSMKRSPLYSHSGKTVRSSLFASYFTNVTSGLAWCRQGILAMLLCRNVSQRTVRASFEQLCFGNNALLLRLISHLTRSDAQVSVSA
jgi:hypothetical protein